MLISLLLIDQSHLFDCPFGNKQFALLCIGRQFVFNIIDLLLKFLQFLADHLFQLILVVRFQ